MKKRKYINLHLLASGKPQRFHEPRGDISPDLAIPNDARIADPAEHITSGEMKKWIGIMIARTLSPIPNMDDLWRDEDDGFIPAHRFTSVPLFSKNLTEFF